MTEKDKSPGQINYEAVFAPKNGVIDVVVPPAIYIWEETADEIRQRFESAAQQVRQPLLKIIRQMREELRYLAILSRQQKRGRVVEVLDRADAELERW
jgi:PleD family two-component response regulator